MGQKHKVLHLILRFLETCTIVGLFAWQASVSVDKFNAGVTSLQERLEDTGTILYPSITFCAKHIFHTFPGIIDRLKNNKTDISFIELKQIALLKSWSMEKMFHFVSHKNFKNKNPFPCNTIGGASMGKPCIFPFTYESINSTEFTFDNCTFLDDSSAWCNTRVTENGHYMTGFWGYCSHSCQGQRAEPGSGFNLASRKEPGLWSTALFDLSTWGSGLCHTYNPPGLSEPGVDGQFYALFNKEVTLPSNATSLFRGFKIYIHDKGQFWPGFEMARTGLSRYFMLKENVSWEGSFTVSQKTLVDKPNTHSHCIQDPNYSFQDCIFSWVAKTTGCHLDWFSPSHDNITACTKNSEILRYNEALNQALKARWIKLTELTGCHPKCTVNTYEFIEKTKEIATWGKNWSAAFYLDVKTSSFTSQHEFYAFDKWDLTSSLGGLMGLFIGWSFLSICFLIHDSLRTVAVLFKDRHPKLKIIKDV